MMVQTTTIRQAGETPAPQPDAIAKIRVVTILGLEHSGTTLLARMLGAHPDAVAIGGLKNLPRFLQHKKLCSCGSGPDSCTFWQPVLERLQSAGHDPAELAAALSARRTAPVPARQAAGYVIAAIAAQSGARVIVDTSRHPEWSRLLRPLAGVEVLPVHIYKSPLAQAASAKRKARSVYGEIAKYITRSRSCRAEARCGDGVTLAHQDLCATPRQEIVRIMERLCHIPDSRQVEDWGSCPLHMLGGNRMRASTRSEIKPDADMAGLFSPVQSALLRLCGAAAYAANQRQR